MSVLEHVPAPVPQLVDAEPVRSAGNELPTFAPAGSELFASATPAPPKWDLPALDYGAALRRVEPPQPVAVAPKPIEPTRVVARELPRSATEMFGLAPPEPLIVQSPISTAPAAPTLEVPREPIAAERKVAAEPIRVERRATAIPAAPKESAKIVASTRPTPVVASTPSPAPAAVPAPARIPEPVQAPRRRSCLPA